MPFLRRHRRLTWIALITLAMLLVSAKLFAVERQDDPCRPPRSAPAAERALMPAGLSFSGIGPVTRVTREGRYITVFAITTKPLDEATVLIQDAVTAAGYRPGGMDNEGFEAEVFFNTATYAAGQARLRRSSCKGRWDVDLVLLERRS